jgi:ornithine cyclodeaminase
MLYLNRQHLSGLPLDWPAVISTIEITVAVLAAKEFAQPVKPYLRYKNKTNRIIAMPAFVGGEIDQAGIKWIASFPGNVNKQLPRAHSVTILNEADTGVPVCIVNTSLISGIRTAGVSGYITQGYLKHAQKDQPLSIGICGYGPIGQLHLDMLLALLGPDRISRICIYDIKEIDRLLIPENIRHKVELTGSWHKAFDDADIFITATVSYSAYIDRKPKKGSLYLNVSLRDFLPEFGKWVNWMIVDDWEEVCRENTDIENMNKSWGLGKEGTYDLAAVYSGQLFSKRSGEEVIMFNPMGLAVFDIAIGTYFYRRALAGKVGVVLE